MSSSPDYLAAAVREMAKNMLNQGMLKFVGEASHASRPGKLLESRDSMLIKLLVGRASTQGVRWGRRE